MKPLLYFVAATLPLWGQQCPSIISSTGSPTINCLPTREFGQPQLRYPLTSSVPNLVEGRELNAPYSIAFDRSAHPPIVYVADTANNRVLAWKNSTNLTKGNFADLVIGQVDMLSTNPQGPSQQNSTLPTGLAAPTGVAVDSSGNLYVADAGNNRILRYPAPFSQTLSPLQVDLVIGQANANSGSSANQGKQTPGPATLFLSISSNGILVRTGMAFDSGGNLWVTDTGNNRVLRLPASNLTPNTSQPAADLVLGQFDFVSNGLPSGANQTQTNNQYTVEPLDLTFDQSGDLYVADSYSRVLFFTPPFSNGLKAARVLGIPPTPAQGGPAVTYPNQYSLGVPNASGQVIPPECVFTVGNNLFVCDSGANRIVYYDVPANWPAATATQPSPPLIGTSPIGQGDFVSGTANRGLPQNPNNGIGIDGNALSFPLGAAVFSGTSGTELWIADTGNNRVLAFPQQGSLNFPAPTRVVGQTDFQYNSPNLVEGREVNFYPATQIVKVVNGQAATLLGAAVAVDTSSTPPHLYVADTQNNRVLGFKDANNVLPGQTADIVIGQANLFSTLPNYPNNGPSSGSQPVNPTATGLYNPSGVAVDANGNLLVADSGNGRVLRFPAPFSQPAGALQQANLVLGQTSFTQYDPTPRSQTMSTTYGLALFSDGSLAVSDAVQNRVLIFQRPSGGDFSNGQAAAHVLGQPDFSTVSADSTPGKLNSPHQISTYTSAFYADQLYVADTGNNRVILYNNARVAPNGAPAAFVLNPGFNQPLGVVVNPISGEIWVAEFANNRIDRFPAYQTLIGETTVTAAEQLGSYAPLALSFDAFGNLIVAEASNRVTFYYPQMVFRHEANFNTQSLVPGMLAHVGELSGTGFNLPLAPNPGVLPYPTVLNDVQLLMVGGTNCSPAPTTPAPLFGIDSSEQIHFQVPQCANTSGTQDFMVVRPSTGQIVAVGTFPMGQYNPGFFTLNQAGTGQVAARNSDHVTANGPSTPDARGQEIDLYLTGSGLVQCSGLRDGQVIAPGQVCPTPLRPKIVMVPGPGVLDDSLINYSGLGGFVGGWQINVVIPASVPPGSVNVVVTMESVPSNIGGGPNQVNSQGNSIIGPDAGTNGIPPIQTTIYVK